MIHEESVLLLHSLQTTHSLISTRKIGKRDLRDIHTLLHLYNIQFLWICSHSLPMGKVIVWPTDFFTILSEKWNLSIFSLKSCFQYAYMLGCPFSSTSYWTCINIFFKNPFVQFTIFWRWVHQMNGNLNTSYVDFLVMLCWPPMDKGSFPRLVLLPSQELRFRNISWINLAQTCPACQCKVFWAAWMNKYSSYIQSSGRGTYFQKREHFQINQQ